MSLIEELPALADEERQLLDRVIVSLPLMADLSRSDLLVYRAVASDRAVVIAHARPHSVSSIHADIQVGVISTRREFPLVLRVLAGQRESGTASLEHPSGSVLKDVWAIRSAVGAIVAALCIETTAVEAARHHRRSPVFRSALRDLQTMLVRGEITGAESLSSFGEHDGIMFVDDKRQIRYVSGVADHLYRKLGHAESLLRHSITSLGTNEISYFAALENGRCVELETREGQLIWIRKGLPVRETQKTGPPSAGEQTPWKGILLTVSDVTDIRRREQELRVKAAMIQEIHHRVKNNLQTVASLLRIQSRRTHSEEAREALTQAMRRVSAIAVVHDTLSEGLTQTVDFDEVFDRVLKLVAEVAAGAGTRAQTRSSGTFGKLPSAYATPLALALTELVTNAVEHGLAGREGKVEIEAKRSSSRLKVSVRDTGVGLAEGQVGRGLGTQIVRTLIQGELGGTIDWHTIMGSGTEVTIDIPLRWIDRPRA